MTRIPSSEITDRQLYLNRRQFIGTALGAGAAVAAARRLDGQQPAPHRAKLRTVPSPLSTAETPNRWEHITTYNNYYEYEAGSGPGPSRLARNVTLPEAWAISVEGECARPGRLILEDILKGETLEDRTYRHRCVEAWSMVIPWVGFPLANLVRKCEPTSKAKYVEFTSLVDRRQMPGVGSDVLLWPYVEGLRLDEALHPLTLLAVGLYGEVLPNQNGAPLRLVVPWKYGFKGAKAIVRIRFLERPPIGSWQRAYPQAYGFYANVNPAVDHPNWSQATERRLPSPFKSTKTLLFNGYADQVASLYSGMDLRRNY